MTRSSSSDAMVRDVYRAFVRHRRKAVLFFVAVMTGVVLFTLLCPKEYRSEGKLFLRLGRENAMLDATATLGENPIAAVPLSRENEINSVVELLQSRMLLEKVVDQLGPAAVLGRDAQAPSAEGDVAESDSAAGWVHEAGVPFAAAFSAGKGLLLQLTSSGELDDRERAVLDMAKHLKVAAAKKSNVIEVSYEGSQPRLCQAVVAKLIDVYLDEHVRLNRTRGSYDFFAEQTKHLRDDLAKKEADLRDLKNKTGLASPGDQRQIVVARIGRLEDELLHAESARAVAEAKVRQLRQRLAALPDTQVTNETSGFNNEGTDRMRDQFYALQVREKEAQARYTEDHPRMRQIREQVAASRAVLEQEERNRKQVTKEPSRLHHQAELALLTEEPLLASLQAQAGRLRTQLADVRGELGTLNENQMRLATLQREVDLLETDYRKYAVNLEQARIDRQLETQRMSNITVAQPASYEPRPVRPRKMWNLLLGLCAGLCGAVGLPLLLEQWDRLPRTPKDVEKSLDLPTLATVPRLKPRRVALNKAPR